MLLLSLLYLAYCLWYVAFVGFAFGVWCFRLLRVGVGSLLKVVYDYMVCLAVFVLEVVIVIIAP